MRALSLFSGIGAFEKALERLGIEFELVNFCEFDKFAIKSYCEIHGVSEDKNLGDITKIDLDKLPMNIDLLTHGSPCQDFSAAGNGKGGDVTSNTRSSLMWNSVEIINRIRPRIVIWENVKNVLSAKHKHNFEAYIEMLDLFGYKSYYKVLNAKDYGNIPQNRERIFVVSILGDHEEFEFPQKQELKLRLKDMLEDTVDEKYYIAHEKVDKLISGLLEKDYKFEHTEIQKLGHTKCPYSNKNHQSQAVYGVNGVSPALTATDYKHTTRILIECVGMLDIKGNEQVRRVYDKITQYRVRKLTPLECWRLMGFDESDYIKAEKVNSNSQLYKQAGNSIVVNVLEEIYKQLQIIGVLK